MPEDGPTTETCSSIIKLAYDSEVAYTDKKNPSLDA
jgi:hypothetical protein